MTTRVPVPVPPALVAERGTLVVPEAVGVPLIKPVLAFKLKPEGRLVALKLVGLLLARIWKLNADPTVPCADKVLLMTGA